GKAGGNFLEMGLGARSGSLADALVGLADDANTLSANPAGLGQLTGGRVSTLYMDWVDALSGGYLGYGAPFDKGGFGFNFFYLTGDDTYRDNNGNPYGTFTNSDWAGTLGGAYNLNKRMSVGASFKVINETLVDTSTTAFALDIGAMLRAKKGGLS